MIDETGRATVAGVLRFADRGARFALLAVSGWGVLGLVIWLIWLLGDQGDWSTVGYGWLVVYWLSAVVGVLCRYWLPRWELHRRGEGPLILVGLPGLTQLLAHGTVMPFFMVVYLVRDVDQAPMVLIVLGAVVTAIGVVGIVDQMTLLRRLGRRGAT